MRAALLAVLLVASSVASAETVKYRVLVAGRELGSATLTYKLSPDKSLTTIMEMKLNVGGQSLGIRAEDTARSDGTPLRSRYTQTTPSGSEVRSIEYAAGKAIVKNTVGGKTTTREAAYPKGSIKGISDFWFITVRPKVGAKDTSWSLDGTKLKWEQNNDVYLGPKKLIVAGKSVTGHHIRTREAEMWVDNRGMPYRVLLKQDGIEMIWERV